MHVAFVLHALHLCCTCVAFVCCICVVCCTSALNFSIDSSCWGFDGGGVTGDGDCCCAAALPPHHHDATAPHATAQHCVPQHGKTRQSTAWCGTVRQHSAAWHVTEPYVPSRPVTATAQHGTVSHAVSRHGTARHGTAQQWHSTARHCSIGFDGRWRLGHCNCGALAHAADLRLVLCDLPCVCI